LINHVKLRHPAESSAESPVKQSSLKSFVDSPKNINSNLKEQIPTAIEEMVAQDYLPLGIKFVVLPQNVNCASRRVHLTVFPFNDRLK
jgi:hypothetical protein